MRLETMSQNAVLIAGSEGINNVVTYVTVMETPNLYKLITGGELVLSTLYTFQGSPEMLVAAVSRLIEQGISAIAIKPKPYFDKIPGEIIDIANEYKIPLFEIDQAARYREIIKAVYAEINNYQTNLLIEVDRYYQELTNVVLAGGDFDQLLRGLGRRKACPVYFVKADYKLLGSYQGTESNMADVVEWLEQYAGKNSGIRRYTFAQGLHTFPCLMKGQPIGYLLIRDDEVLDEKFMLMAKQLVTFVTLRLIDLLDTEQKMLTALLDDILFKHSLTEDDLRERLELHGLKSESMYRVIIIREKRKGNRDLDRQAARRFANKICNSIYHALVIEKNNEVVLLAANQQLDFIKPPRWLSRLGGELQNDDPPFVVGVGPSSPHAVDIQWSYTMAKNAITVGLAAKGSGILYYMDYLSELVLLGSAGKHEQDFLVSRVIGPIKENDNNDLLLKTIGASIFANELEDAASALGVHINTVRYRLNKVHDITGFDFFSTKGRYVITTAYLMLCYKKCEL